ncbi:MAG: AAA family ATPase [Hydrogenibacillus sp.]|nr:AAA family ATPase [Hydrogenibacillus sp.]
MNDQAASLRARMAERLSAQAAAGANGHARPLLSLAIASGKGGVGKSHLAIGLAYALSALGARVVVIDVDFGFANVDVLLGKRPRATLADVAYGRAALHEAVTAVTDGFDMVAGIADAEGLKEGDERALVGRLIAALSTLDARYDFVLFDFGAGLHRAAQRLLQAVDRVLIVLNSDVAAMVDAYALYKWLVQNGQANVSLVANRVPDASGGGALIERFARIAERYLGQRPHGLGVIREDAHLLHAARHGRSPFPLPAKAVAARDLAQLAVRLVLLARAGGAAGDHKDPPGRSLSRQGMRGVIARLRERLFS